MSNLPPATSSHTTTDRQDDANLVLDTVNSQDADIAESTLNAIENPLEDAEHGVRDPNGTNNHNDNTDSDRISLANDIPPDLIADDSTNRENDQSYHQLCFAAFSKAEQHRQANTTVTTEADATWTALGELERVDRVHRGLSAYPLNAMAGNEIEEIHMDQENGIGLAGMAQGDLRRHF